MIRQPIFDVTLNENVQVVFHRLASNLSRSEFTVISSDPTSMRITISCIVKLFDMGLWRSWSDAVEIIVRQHETDNTQVVVQGKPSWFRTGVKKEERTYSLYEAESVLKDLIRSR